MKFSSGSSGFTELIQLIRGASYESAINQSRLGGLETIVITPYTTHQGFGK
jgi:hypothetical protein